MNMQKCAIFAKKNLKINTLKIKNRKVRDHCHYTREYRAAAQGMCSVK